MCSPSPPPGSENLPPLACSPSLPPRPGANEREDGEQFTPQALLLKILLDLRSTRLALLSRLLRRRHSRHSCTCWIASRSPQRSCTGRRSRVGAMLARGPRLPSIRRRLSPHTNRQRTSCISCRQREEADALSQYHQLAIGRALPKQREVVRRLVAARLLRCPHRATSRRQRLDGSLHRTPLPKGLHTYKRQPPAPSLLVHAG